MKRSEFIQKVEQALHSKLEIDGYIAVRAAEIALEVIDELRMLPPTNTCRIITDDNGITKHSPSKREWDEEV